MDECKITRRAWAAAALGLFGSVWAIGVAGAGHGWVSPLFISTILPFVWPLAMWRWYDGPWPLYVEALLAAGMIAANAWLVRSSLEEGTDYVVREFHAAPALVIPWAAVWLGWQALLLVALIRRR